MPKYCTTHKQYSAIQTLLNLKSLSIIILKSYQMQEQQPHPSPQLSPYPLRPDLDENQESSFYGEVKSESQKPEGHQQEHHPKHKSSKHKKKHINKKKQKISIPPKKPYTSKEKQKEQKLYLLAQKKADEVMAKMKYYYDKDLVLQEKKKMACLKLHYMEELGKDLKNIYVCEKFIERDGITLFERWLDKVTINEETFEPGVSIRKGVLEILLGLNLNPENISKTNEIQRLVARQKRSQVKQLRQLSQQIIRKWNKISYEAQ